MVTQKRRRRGLRPGRRHQIRTLKDGEVVGVQEEATGSPRPWDRMGEGDSQVSEEWLWTSRDGGGDGLAQGRGVVGE